MWSEFVDGTNLIQRSWCGSRVAALSHVSYKHSLCRNSSLTLSSSPLILIPSSSHGLPSPSHPSTCPHPPLTLALSSSPRSLYHIPSLILPCMYVCTSLSFSSCTLTLTLSLPSFPLPYTGLAVVQWERGCGVRRTWQTQPMPTSDCTTRGAGWSGRWPQGDNTTIHYTLLEWLT